jgi:lysophospholipase L1-like esterase
MAKLTHRAAFSVALFLSVASAVARDATTKPTTRPATTAERAADIAYNSAPADQATIKRSFLGWHGEVGDNFGQPDARFLQKHAEFLERGKSPAGVLFLGDSITEGWGGAPDVWNAAFGKYDPANFGIGGDNTSHVLWRIANGELDVIRPKVVVIMIGTNSIVWHDAHQIATGTTAVVHAVREKLSESKILLLGIFPRMEKPNEEWRLKLKAANVELAKLADDHIRYFEIWDQFLGADGVMSKDIMPDFLHPNAKGYQIWADAMGPVLAEMMK